MCAPDDTEGERWEAFAVRLAGMGPPPVLLASSVVCLDAAMPCSAWQPLPAHTPSPPRQGAASFPVLPPWSPCAASPLDAEGTPPLNPLQAKLQLSDVELQQLHQAFKRYVKQASRLGGRPLGLGCDAVTASRHKAESQRSAVGWLQGPSCGAWPGSSSWLPPSFGAGRPSTPPLWCNPGANCRVLVWRRSGSTCSTSWQTFLRCLAALPLCSAFHGVLPGGTVGASPCSPASLAPQAPRPQLRRGVGCLPCRRRRMWGWQQTWQAAEASMCGRQRQAVGWR